MRKAIDHTKPLSAHNRKKLKTEGKLTIKQQLDHPIGPMLLTAEQFKRLQSLVAFAMEIRVKDSELGGVTLGWEITDVKVGWQRAWITVEFDCQALKSFMGSARREYASIERGGCYAEFKYTNGEPVLDRLDLHDGVHGETILSYKPADTSNPNKRLVRIPVV